MTLIDFSCFSLEVYVLLIRRTVRGEIDIAAIFFWDMVVVDMIGPG
jgi:hypothetical protein